ncbi:hypothetical protein OAQ16_02900 [Flavobacteriales bacterium]|nr:hypothetical protein [Flavobacteriales bacterium]
MTKLYCSFFILAIFVLTSCDEPGIVGLEVQPSSDKIEIFSNNFSQTDSLPALTISTESVDSLRTDETSSLLLGKISQPYDPYFGDNIGAFVTQIALTESNIDLGNNPVVDSVIFSYSYSGYYGDLSEPINIAVNYVDLNIYKDSVYYSNHQFSNSSANSEDLLLDFIISSDTSTSPKLKMTLDNSIGQQILDLGNSILVDNETFQENFGFFSFNEYSLIANSIIYLNPSGSNSNFTVYYQNSTSDNLSLTFALDGDAARINLFNEKTLSNLTIDPNLSYIQSMAGYKANIALENINLIKEDLEGKAINKVTLSFIANDDSFYPSHENLSLVRVDSAGNNVFLTDLSAEGVTHFGGEYSNGKYEFNITRYFNNLLNNDAYTNQLYLLASGGAVNANRTIIDNSSIKISILYSKL